MLVWASLLAVICLPLQAKAQEEFFYPDLVACHPNTDCDEGNNELQIIVRPPLTSGTYATTYCTSHPCLPTETPIGNWIVGRVKNAGRETSPIVSAGLYLSAYVSSDASRCALDSQFPLQNAVQVGHMDVPSLPPGASTLFRVPYETEISFWMASQRIADRDSLYRCLFLYVDDTNEVYEEQTSESSNLASVVVRLVDLVDLTPSMFSVSFNHLPWIRGQVVNTGVVTAPDFHVDFYATPVDPVSEECPVLTNKETPLVAGLQRGLYYLGSGFVEELEPFLPRVVYPRLNRVPPTATNDTFYCIIMYIDAVNVVSEPKDGVDNVLFQKVPVHLLRRFVFTPEVIEIEVPFNTALVALITAIVLVVASLVIFIWQFLKRRSQQKAVQVSAFSPCVANEAL